MPKQTGLVVLHVIGRIARDNDIVTIVQRSEFRRNGLPGNTAHNDSILGGGIAGVAWNVGGDVLKEGHVLRDAPGQTAPDANTEFFCCSNDQSEFGHVMQVRPGQVEEGNFFTYATARDLKTKSLFFFYTRRVALPSKHTTQYEVLCSRHFLLTTFLLLSPVSSSSFFVLLSYKLKTTRIHNKEKYLYKPGYARLITLAHIKR